MGVIHFWLRQELRKQKVAFVQFAGHVEKLVSDHKVISISRLILLNN